MEFEPSKTTITLSPPQDADPTVKDVTKANAEKTLRRMGKPLKLKFENGVSKAWSTANRQDPQNRAPMPTVSARCNKPMTARSNLGITVASSTALRVVFDQTINMQTANEGDRA